MIASLWGIWSVWLRYFAVFKNGLPYYITTAFLEPVLYLASFAFGVGALVGEVSVGGEVMSYRPFVFSGILAQTLLFQGFFEGAYGGFFRLHYQRIFQAISATPITLSEVIWAELLWCASKATLASLLVTLIGIATGHFLLSCIWLIVPACFLSALLFGALGLCAAGRATLIDHLAYPQFLFVFPMFLFCGVFYPIDLLPQPLPTLVWILPLTSVLSLLRTVTLGQAFEPQALAIAVLWVVVAVFFARRLLISHIVK